MAIRDEQLLENVTVTANGASSVFNNDGRGVWSLVVRTGTPTGTSPTLTFALAVSLDGINFVQAGGNLTAIGSSGGSQRTVYAVGSTQGPIVEPFVKVTWATGGTSPSFPNTFADLIGL